MKSIYNSIFLAFLLILVSASCSEDESMEMMELDFSGTYVQADQMGRPAINTVFIPSQMKDEYNETVPSKQAAKFKNIIESGLTGLSPAYSAQDDKNALGLDAATFASVLATDVLTVSLEGTTTFYDGTNILTGRNLRDDVITVELLLIFGGEDFSENPGFSDDNVDMNDKAFSADFPYLANPW
jgi:hypothetical protein